MRIFTEKDKKALIKAIRAFLRTMSGERLSTPTGTKLVEKALGGGLTLDELLNPGNWIRAKEVCAELDANEYVDLLLSGGVEVRKLSQEPQWHEPASDFTVVAEAAHDFFMEVTGRGGKWNIPSALTNLAKAIRRHGLQPLLSEALIEEVIKDDAEMTYFGYIEAITRDFNSLPVDSSLSEEQQKRADEQEEAVSQHVQTVDVVKGIDEETLENVDRLEHNDEDPNEAPYPDWDDRDEHEAAFETMVVGRNPNEHKRESIINILANYSPSEIMGIIDTVEGGRNMPMSDLIDCLTYGRFSPALEKPETRTIHKHMSADLLPSFIDSVRMQGIEMDEETAAGYDILHDSWDLRTPEVRKLYKLRKLIIMYGSDDEDLQKALEDIENLYMKEED